MNDKEITIEDVCAEELRRQTDKDSSLREAFEKWYGSSPERHFKYPEQYEYVLTQARWEAFQAGAAYQAACLSKAPENEKQADLSLKYGNQAAQPVQVSEEVKFPHKPAAFINAIAEDGTKAEAIRYLQETWNEVCALREIIQNKENRG